MLIGCCSSSVSSSSSSSCSTGMRETGAGDELWTVIEGVDEPPFVIWVRSEFRRERERVLSAEGGGDFIRGDTGQWGVLSPELVPEVDFSGRGTLDGSCLSWVEAGASGGVVAEFSARWMAAAEGTEALEPALTGPLLGLASLLFLRERSPDLGSGPEAACWRWGGRAGDVSREDKGEFAAEGELDAFSDLGPLSVFRLGTRDSWFDAGAGATGRFGECS